MSARDFSWRFLPVVASTVLDWRALLSIRASTGFLQHALLVAGDDFRGVQLDQLLQAVVAVDDAAVQVVQVGGGKAAAVERHHRAQVRRDDRHGGQDHPFRTDAGLQQGLEQLDPADQLVVLGAERLLGDLPVQLDDLPLQVDVHQKAPDGFRPDAGLKTWPYFRDHS